MVLFKNYLNQKNIQKILKRKPGEEGFSLVELVVVIAVLAILSAVAIPAFQGVQARAKTSAVKNGLVNGVKECIVSDGLDAGTTFNVSQAYAGNYTGYTVTQLGARPNSCYAAEANPPNTQRTTFPWFTINYDETTGITTKQCDANKVGCNNSTW